MKIFENLLDSYERENPEWIQATSLRLVHDAVYSLKTYLEAPGDTAISWELPAAELRYPFEADWKGIDKGGWESLGTEQPGVTLFSVTAEDLKDEERLTDKLAKGFVQTQARFVFEVLAGGNPLVDPLEVAVYLDGDKEGLSPVSQAP